jgi:hypothetical protein
MVLISNQNESRYYLYDNIKKKYLSTVDFTLFLEELSQIPNGSTIYKARKCTAPFDWAMSDNDRLRLREIVENRKLTIDKGQFVTCTCRALGVKFPDDYCWGCLKVDNRERRY